MSASMQRFAVFALVFVLKWRLFLEVAVCTLDFEVCEPPANPEAIVMGRLELALFFVVMKKPYEEPFSV